MRARALAGLGLALAWAVGAWLDWSWETLLALTGAGLAAAAAAAAGFRMQARRRRAALDARVRALLAGDAGGGRVAAALAARSPAAPPLSECPVFVATGGGGVGIDALLQHAGLRWHLRAARGPGAVDWWVCDACVVVRPRDPSQPSWQKLASALAALRPRRPVDGILAVVDAVEVGAGAAARRLGHELRSRVDAVQELLVANAPVTVVLSKCDQLPGFTAFFGRASATQRRALAGLVMPPTGAAGPARARVEAAFSRLARGAGAVVWGLMRGTADLEQREQMMALVAALDSLPASLAAMVDALLGDDAHAAQSRPSARLRAVLLTSASPPRATGLHAALPGQSTQVTNAPFFTQELFPRAWLPDAASCLAERRDAGPQAAQAAAWALAVALAAIAPVAFWEAHQTIEEARLAVLTARETGAAGDREDPRERPLNPSQLAPLAAEVGRAQRRQLRAGWLPERLRMAPATPLRELLERELARQVRAQVAQPLVAAAMQEELPSADPLGEDFDPHEVARAAEAIRMVGLLAQETQGSEHPSESGSGRWLARTLASRWAQAIGEKDEAAGHQMRAWARLMVAHLAREPGLRLPGGVDWLLAARRQLALLPAEDLYLALLTRDAEAYTLDLGLLVGEHRGFAGVAGQVWGGYTREGFEQVVEPRLGSPPLAADEWVALGNDTAAALHKLVDGGSDAVAAAYWRRYADTWRRFLRALPNGDGGPSPHEAQALRAMTAEQLARLVATAGVQALAPIHHQRLEAAVDLNLLPAQEHVAVPHLSDIGL